MVFFQQSDVYLFHEIWSGCGYLDRWVGVDKAPRLSISIVTWILSSDTICQLNQFNTNSEAAMLSRLVRWIWRWRHTRDLPPTCACNWSALTAAAQVAGQKETRTDLGAARGAQGSRR